MAEQKKDTPEPNVELPNSKVKIPDYSEIKKDTDKTGDGKYDKYDSGDQVGHKI